MPELAELRSEHLRVRAKVGLHAVTLREAEARWKAEDRQYAAALQATARAESLTL